MWDVSYHTISHMLKAVNIFTNNSANQDGTVPFENVEYIMAGEHICKLKIF